MSSTTVMQAGIVMFAVYLIAAAIVVTVGPLVDQTDQRREETDLHSFPTANQALITVRQLFYGIIGISCAVTTGWFFLVIIAKLLYRRQESQQYPYYQYTTGYRGRP